MDGNESLLEKISRWWQVLYVQYITRYSSKISCIKFQPNVKYQRIYSHQEEGSLLSPYMLSHRLTEEKVMEATRSHITSLTTGKLTSSGKKLNLWTYLKSSTGNFLNMHRRNRQVRITLDRDQTWKRQGNIRTRTVRPMVTCKTFVENLDNVCNVCL